jgi:hypothetical protein
MIAYHRAPERDIVNVLKAQVDDQGQEIQDLRRQLNELRHTLLDVQRAQNDAAPLILALYDRPGSAV